MRYFKYKEILFILTFYIFITISLTTINASLYANIINPLFWSCVLIYIIFKIKKDYIRFNKNRKYFIYMTIISCVCTMLYFYFGFIFGFAKSPYNHEMLSILKNIFVQIIPIISIEIVRSVIVTKNANNKLAIVFITILLILAEMDYSSLINLFSNKESFFKYICGSILPLISCSILYTYLTLKGSYSLTLVFRLSNRLVVLLLPILSATNWYITGSFGMLFPTLIYVLFKYQFVHEKSDIRKKKKNLSTKISYALTLTISTTLVCFMLGLFKYEPIAILSNSMLPSFSRGDVVIFEKLTDSELQEISNGSIIVYQIGEQNVAHRIVNIIKENHTVFYQTKGDNNNAPDVDLVDVEQIKGIYVSHIKYIGFPSIWLYEYFNSEDVKVETK